MHKMIYISLLVILILQGCITPEKIVYREEFFQPLMVPPQRKVVTFNYEELEKLRRQLDSTSVIVAMLKDSLESLRNYSSTLLASVRSTMEKAEHAENTVLVPFSKHEDIDQKIAELKMENKKLSEQINQLQAKLISNVSNRILPSPEETTVNRIPEYNDALMNFYRKKYDEAKNLFDNLLRNGIEEELRDNCEYWIGECYFATRRYVEAINQFQKVINIATSNKKVDAYYMIGRCYEKMGYLEKARQVYIELNNKFPYNQHYKRATMRSEIIGKELLKRQHQNGMHNKI